MSSPRVVAVAPGSPAALAGVAPGDELASIDGSVPRDVIQYQVLVDGPDVTLDVVRDGRELRLEVPKADGEPLGVEVHSSLFDQVRTCDNHCSFCFIYQLPKGMRRSLYLKDDDHRLSFLYGNYTTLTRFTEADLERVVTERLSPLNVSIHATDPQVRAELLRNRRGATSLRWLRALLDHGIEVHGQVVVCPGVNDGEVLADTLAGVLDQYPELASLCIVPLGVSRHSNEPGMRPHTAEEAGAVLDLVEQWQQTFLTLLGRRVAFAADEYHLVAGRPFPDADAYEGFAMHEDGIGMVRTFERELRGEVEVPTGVRPGFFAWVEGAPPEGYRAPRQAASAGSCAGAAPSGADGSHLADAAGAPDAVAVSIGSSRRRPTAVLTGGYGAQVLRPLLEQLDVPEVRVVEVENRFFGGNIAVAGLLVGEDLARTLADEPSGHRYLLPDVCLSEGRFLDDVTVQDLPRPVEVVPTDGVALRRALGLGAGAARVPVGAP